MDEEGIGKRSLGILFIGSGLLRIICKVLGKFFDFLGFLIFYEVNEDGIFYVILCYRIVGLMRYKGRKR